VRLAGTGAEYSVVNAKSSCVYGIQISKFKVDLEWDRHAGAHISAKCSGERRWG
jgi:hypothetical protein